MSDGKDAGFYIELQSTGSRDFKRVVLRPPRTTYFPGAFFMRGQFWVGEHDLPKRDTPFCFACVGTCLLLFGERFL